MATSKDNNEWSAWLEKIVGADSAGAGYRRIASKVLGNARVGEGDTVLDIGTGRGLLALAAAGLVGSEGKVIGVDAEAECVSRCQRRAAELGLKNVTFIEGDARSLPVEDAATDVVVCRSVLCHIVDKAAAIQEWRRVLDEGGRFSLYEPVDRYDTRLSDLVDLSPLGDVAASLKAAEERTHINPEDSLMNFDEAELRHLLLEAGFAQVNGELTERSREYKMTASSARDWWHVDIGGVHLPGHRSPYELLCEHLPAADLDRCVELFCSQMDGKTIEFRSKQLYMWGHKKDGGSACDALASCNQ